MKIKQRRHAVQWTRQLSEHSHTRNKNKRERRQLLSSGNEITEGERKRAQMNDEKSDEVNAIIV